MLVSFSAGPVEPSISLQQARYEDSRVSMATVYTIVVYGKDMPALKQIVDAAFDEIDRIDRLMSNYRKESELSRINKDAHNGPVRVDQELFDFIAVCLRYSRQTYGAFDVTVGALMKAWGFFRGEGRMPADNELNLARSRTGYRHVILDKKEKKLHFDKEGIEIDLGGVAKGYAVDRAIAILKRNGVISALVNAGGSTIYALGSPPGSDAWEVMVQDPLDSNKTAATLKLKDQALSVSGNYVKFFDLGGVRYSHILDPRTGWPVQGVLSVAVVTRTGTDGDALDNAFYVLGVNKSRAIIHKFPVLEVFFFLPDAEKGWKMIQLKNGSISRGP